MDRIKKNYTTKNYIKTTLRVLFELEKPKKFRVKAKSLLPAHFFYSGVMPMMVVH